MLYHDVVAMELVPARVLDDIGRFNTTWPPSRSTGLWMPLAEPARAAGLVHLMDDLDEFTLAVAPLAMVLIPAKPFLGMGQ